ncbi:hypothetical protein GFS31_19770 [Leptolyngbya sp. BL0902]|nr:hypothetical protein GFS31_19770 [Leptolyngbya sp. BL0902]
MFAITAATDTIQPISFMLSMPLLLDLYHLRELKEFQSPI